MISRLYKVASQRKGRLMLLYPSEEKKELGEMVAENAREYLEQMENEEERQS